MTTLGDLVNEFCDILKNRFVTVNLSQIFTELQVSEKIPFTYDLLESENFFPKLDENCLKSAAKAVQFRNLGNDAFCRKKDIEALKFYIRSVAFAPSGSPELALAYANRSAVLFRLEKYVICLIDINRALKSNYPDALKPKLYDRKEKCKLKLSAQSVSKENELMKSVAGLTIRDNTSSNNATCQVEQSEVNYEATDLNFGRKFEIPEAILDNEMIPNASKKIEMSFTPQMGRHLVATEDIEPGEILAIEKPYASILLPSFNYTHCSYCYIRSESLIPCTECALIMFCSERCRKKAFNLFHRTECQIFSTVLSLSVGEMEWLAFRTLMIATKQGQKLKALMNDPFYRFPITKKYCSFSKKYISDDYTTVHNLEDNFTKRCVADIFQRSVAVAVLLYLLKQTTFFNEADFDDAQSAYTELTDGESFVGTLLLKYLFNALSNAHEVSELVEEKRPHDSKFTNHNLGIGAALYTLHSLTNHSCDPNVVRHNHKDTIVSRSIQPVKAGEQLFDNYGYHYATHPREQRHNHLRLQYFFECCCNPCKFDWPLHGHLPTESPEIITNKVNVNMLNEYSAIFRKKLDLLADAHDEEQFEFMCEYLSVLHKNTKRPSKEYNECQECIKQILAIRANHYKVPYDCVLLKL